MMTPEQLVERKSGIGGSDLAAVLGLSPWRSPVDVWMDKTGKSEPQEETPAMYWGSQLEDLVAREYAKRTGRVVSRLNAMVRHHSMPLLAHIDRAVGEIGGRPVMFGKINTDRLLECKTASGFAAKDWGDEGTDQVPLYYITQVQHYMGLTGTTVTDIACLFDGRDFRVFTVPLDDELLQNMWQQAAEWWEKYVKTDTPPPPRGMADCQKLFRKSAPRKVVAHPSIENAATLLAKVRDQIAALETQEQAHKDMIAAAMGDAEELTTRDDVTLVTWKSSKPVRKTDWEAVALNCNAPQSTIDANTKEVPGSRRFLVKIKVEAENKENEA